MTPVAKQLSQAAGPDRRVGRVCPFQVSNPRRNAATTGATSADQWAALVCDNAVWLSMMSLRRSVALRNYAYRYDTSSSVHRNCQGRTQILGIALPPPGSGRAAAPAFGPVGR